MTPFTNGALRAPVAAAVAFALVACATPPRPAALMAPSRVQTHATGFDCGEVEAAWQAFACRDAALAAAELRLRQTWLQQFRALDGIGQAELLAEQRHWQRSLVARCALDTTPADGTPLPVAKLECLQHAWRSRTDALLSMPAAVEGGLRPPHPLSAYVAFRAVQSVKTALCSATGTRLEGVIAEHGELRLERVPGWQLLASSRGRPQATLPDGRRVEVQAHDAGPYGGHEWRATGLLLNGRRVVDERTVPAWTLELPNAGGSFSGSSSQTGDYAQIDVVQQEQRLFVLVHQTWGYHASAARGESPHSALYEIDASGLQRRCLWRTYTTPAVAQALRFLPRFSALQSLLDAAAGPDTTNLAPNDRRDAGLLATKWQWEQLNMPLLVVQEATRPGRWLLLRQRHDEALEAVFAWSERNLPSKLLYRRLMPIIAPAHAELVQGFEANDGLKTAQARTAADLVLMSAIARAAERLQDPDKPRPGPAGNRYAPRYAVAPPPGELEDGRAYGGLHSALLSRAPPRVIDDLWRQTWGRTDRVGDAHRGLGPAGDTPLMAAVRSPDMLRRLISGGADVDARNAWGKTALMTAAQADQLDSVLALIEAAADVRARTAAWQADGAGGPDNAEGATIGRSALHHAAAAASAELLEALLAAGADPAATDAQGLSACRLLDDNARLTPDERSRLRGKLCESR